MFSTTKRHKLWNSHLRSFWELASSNKICTDMNLEDLLNMQKNFKISEQLKKVTRCHLMIMSLTELCCDFDLKKITIVLLFRVQSFNLFHSNIFLNTDHIAIKRSACMQREECIDSDDICSSSTLKTVIRIVRVKCSWQTDVMNHESRRCVWTAIRASQIKKWLTWS